MVVLMVALEKLEKPPPLQILHQCREAHNCGARTVMDVRIQSSCVLQSSLHAASYTWSTYVHWTAKHNFKIALAIIYEIPKFPRLLVCNI